MEVLAADAGTHGLKIISAMPSPEASGATHCVKFNEPEIVPDTTRFTVVAAVAFARTENPQMYVVTEAAPASVATAPVVVAVALDV